MEHKYSRIEVNFYIDKLMNNLWDETLMGNTKTIFLNTKKMESVPECVDSFLQSISEKTEVYRQRISNRKFSKPYYPFLDFIKDAVKLKSREELQYFVEKADVYYFQQPVFLSYFLDETIQRKEDIILGELTYEKDRMHKSILDLYYSLSKNTPMVVVIENLHHAKQSTLELIQYIIKTKGNNKIFFIFSFNKEYKFEVEEKQKKWNDFIQCVHIHDSIIDVEVHKNINKDSVKRNEEENVLKMEEIIDLSMINFHFLALQEAKEYITGVYNERMVSNTYLTCKYFFRMFHILGDVHYYLEENNNALLYYNSLLNFSQKSKNLKEISYCYEKIGLIYWKKGNVKRAERLGKQSLKYALELQDEILILHSNFLLFLVGHKGNEMNIEQIEKCYYSSIEIAKKLNLNNILSYFYTQPFEVVIQSEEERIKLSNLGIAIAKKYDNKYRLSAAYHAQGVLHKLKGTHDKGLKYYKKSEKLKLELGYKLEIVYIYNGLGFYNFIQENYEEAYCYYYEALEYLKNIRDYNEIANTLFNIAYNYYLALQFPLAIKYLEKLLLIINIVKMDSTNYHTMLGVYSLIGINYCKIGEISKAYEYMIKINEIGTICYLDDDNFLSELFKGLFNKMEGDYENATYHFEKTISYIQKLKYIAPKFYYEYGLLKKEEGKKDEAEVLFKKGIQYCEELQYTFNKDLLLKELGEKKKIKEIFQLNNEFADLKWIIDYANQEVTINDLHKKINEINFLNILHEIIGKEKKKDKLIENVMNLIHETFLVECSFLHLKEQNKWKSMYCNEVLDASHLEVFTLIETLTKEQKIIFISNVKEDLKYKEICGKFYSIINIPLIDRDELIGNILCATQKDEILLNYDDVKVLSMAGKQLVNALRKISRDEEILQKKKELFEVNEDVRLKTEFICNLSHEFRTPLNVILGALQLLNINIKDRKESKYLKIMKQNCYRLLRLINNLIDISKIDSGFYKLNLENYNIVNIVEEITLSIAAYIEQKGITLEFDTNVEEKIMGCDVDQMERVILNLLSNSVKFTKRGGKINVNFYDKGKTILIVIKDNGIGIPEDKLNIIFERFGQVDRSLNRSHEGSGIGLSLVKSIVEMNGGKIFIESEYGKGSIFTIELPAIVLLEKDLILREDYSITSDLVERTQVELSDIYF